MRGRGTGPPKGIILRHALAPQQRRAPRCGQKLKFESASAARPELAWDEANGGPGAEALGSQYAQAAWRAPYGSPRRERWRKAAALAPVWQASQG
jgi:hypothetical protein